VLFGENLKEHFLNCINEIFTLFCVCGLSNTIQYKVENLKEHFLNCINEIFTHFCVCGLSNTIQYKVKIESYYT